jgi:hypothetical protein
MDHDDGQPLKYNQESSQNNSSPESRILLTESSDQHDSSHRFPIVSSLEGECLNKSACTTNHDRSLASSIIDNIWDHQSKIEGSRERILLKM